MTLTQLIENYFKIESDFSESLNRIPNTPGGDYIEIGEFYLPDEIIEYIAVFQNFKISKLTTIRDNETHRIDIIS